MKNKRYSYYLLIVLAALLLAVDAFYVTYGLVNNKEIFDTVGVIFLSINSAVIVIMVVIVIIFFVSGNNERNMIIRQNLYNFNRKILFSNFNTFVTLVGPRYLKVRKTHEEGYIICFSPFNDRTVLELESSPTYIQYNGLIVDYISSYFKNSHEFHRNDYEYCYSNKSFLMYVRKPYSVVEKIVRDFENEAYEIKAKNNFRIFVQPFFGIYKIQDADKVSLFDAINNTIVARRYGENNYEVSVLYDDTLDAHNKDNPNDITVESILEGLKENEFEVYYQPKFHLKSKKFVGAEALIRWKSKRFGFVQPDKFISLAENAGIIHDIDIYLLDKVCATIEEWKKRGREILPISVNVSLYEFYEPAFVNDIQSVLEKHNVNPIYIEIEITEKTNSAYSFLIVNVLNKIKDMKIKILMDDFGTGFSNIVNLKKLPIDIVKLDKSLVDDIAFDIKEKEIVRAVILSCHAMNIQIIAEGADSKEQIQILSDLACDVIQGYYYSQPLPKTEYERFLSNNDFEKKGKLV
jgi:EAL domain-containing protein (putative c-di-GMP-specific phosphodiesterase class I)